VSCGYGCEIGEVCAGEVSVPAGWRGRVNRRVGPWPNDVSREKSSVGWYAIWDKPRQKRYVAVGEHKAG
jgi:hypothetical protein